MSTGELIAKPTLAAGQGSEGSELHGGRDSRSLAGANYELQDFRGLVGMVPEFADIEP
jgi:hypothetical protein